MPKYILTDDKLEKVIELYKNPEIRVKDIAKKFNIGKDTVLRAMRRHGIPIRKQVGRRAEENSNWKGGKSSNYARRIAINNLKENRCVICGYNITTDIHHIDNNSKNNVPENLIILCPNHHREVHLGLINIKKLKEILRHRGQVGI